MAEQLNGASTLVQFICDFLGDALTAAAMEYAPELAGEEVWADVDFQAACQDAGAQIQLG